MGKASRRRADLVKDVVSAIRNIRGENRISPAEKLKVRLAPNDDKVQKILSLNRNALMTMGRLESVDIGAEGNLSKCAVTLVSVKDSQVKVIIPLEGLVDISEEINRIQKTLEKLNKDIAQFAGRLSNESFVKNAAEDVVEADRLLLAQFRKQAQSLTEALMRLQG